MRPPRHRFSDGVRSATREAAARMVADGTVPATAEELDAWIGAAPAIRDAMVRGGYGAAFGAADLLPLLHVFVEQAGGSVPFVLAPGEVEPAPPARSRLLLAVVAVVVFVAVVGFILTRWLAAR